MSYVPEKGSSEEDVWDDTLLIKAYDNSLSLVKEQLARRIASSTNSKSVETPPTKQSEDDPERATATVSKESQSTNNEFKEGDYVRATYEDGVDYEAKITSIDRGQGMCVLKYIGYDNEEEVRIADVIPSWGKKARRTQFARAKPAEAGDEATTSKDLKKNKSKRTVQSNSLPFGSVPPPPPMPPMVNELSEDSEHLSAMLMSWYMSGYYTGLYQGMRTEKAKTRSNKK